MIIMDLMTIITFMLNSKAKFNYIKLNITITIVHILYNCYCESNV